MKLSVFLLLCSIGLAQATDSYAQKATVNLEMRNQTVKEVLDEIEEQSDFSFFFNIKHVDLHRRVSVVAKKSDIFKVLETVFAGTDVRYSVVDRKIILSTEKQEIQQINQDKKVTGVIKDQHGEPVIGANVSVKGTTIGTITGIDGDFALEVPANAVIQVSYIGYVPQELRLGGKNHLDVVLKEDSQALDEIVVVGYGVQKKINLTGSVSSVKSEELERQPIVTMKDALAGLVPGLTVVKSSGQPGSSNPTITVRGVGTWKNAGPLVLVDGMSMSIADVLPNDIESISVLKDAASAAIYGSRAANGVILITTKKGKEGKVQVNYNGNVGWQQATRQPKSATGWQYAELYNRAMLADGKALPDGTTLLFPQDKIDRMKNGTGDIDHNEANTDWFDELLHTALQHTHDISITGGNDRVQYVGTVGYAKQDGIIESSYERYNTRLNTTANLADWLTIQSNIAYINDVSKESPGLGYAYYYAPRSFPNMPVKYSDGTWSFHSTPKNPVRMTTDEYGDRKSVV